MGDRPDQKTYTFDEQVGLVAQALDDIRYEDGVEYEHRDMARQLAEVEDAFSDLYHALEENQEKWGVSQELYDEFAEQAGESLDEYADSALGEAARAYMEHEKERMEEHKELLLKESDLWEQYCDVQDRFGEIKYNEHQESGPGAFVVAVNGPASEYMEHVEELDGTEWGRTGREPRVDDPDLAQLIYDTLGNHSNDGAAVMAEDDGSGQERFLPQTVWIPDAAVSQNAYLNEGGTKHRAAVNAVYSDIRNDDGEELVRASLVLSSTDGKIREFRRGDYLGELSEEQLAPLFEGEEVDVTQLRFDSVEKDGMEAVRLYRDVDDHASEEVVHCSVEDVYPDYAGEDPEDLVLRETEDGIDLWEQDIRTFNYDADDMPRVPVYWEEDGSHTSIPGSVSEMFRYWDEGSDRQPARTPKPVNV